MGFDLLKISLEFMKRNKKSVLPVNLPFPAKSPALDQWSDGTQTRLFFSKLLNRPGKQGLITNDTLCP